MLHINEVRRQFSNLLLTDRFEVNKDGSRVLEMVGCTFDATGQETIFGKPNYGYINDEIRWYNSMSRKPSDLKSTPKIWKDIMSRHGYINSNYGWCIFSNKHTDTYEHNHDQYAEVYETLRKHPSSRQAVMIYTRPTMHKDAFDDGMHDFMCTNTVQYLIRDNKLHCVVNMRSNDAVFGYKNDWAWQNHILWRLANDLGIPPGNITWQTGSLHVYERHFYLIEEWQKEQNAHLKKLQRLTAGMEE